VKNVTLDYKIRRPTQVIAKAEDRDWSDVVLLERVRPLERAVKTAMRALQ
jgi:hypothetical protein